jgi:hypothetical protein
MMLALLRNAVVAGLIWALLSGSTQKPVQSLDWLHGEWRGEGTLQGRPGKVSLSVGPVLDQSATALSYAVEIAKTDTAPAFRFEGRGTYRVAADGKVMGQWSDSFGNFHPLSGKVSGQKLIVTWGEPRTEVGQSSYELDAAGQLRTGDWVLTSGALKPFAEARYRRVQ